MTPPDTNLNTQARRHRAPLWGIALAVIIAIGLLTWMLTRTMVVEPTANEAQSPAQSRAQTEGTTTGIPAEGSVSGPNGAGAPPADERQSAPLGD